MRLGIFGGTFDPVHYGHLLLAEICRQQLQLDQVRILPAGNPPHKPGLVISDARARAEMLSFAVAGYPEFVVDEREVRRSGPSYTVDTLAEFSHEDPDSELFLLIGADSLRDLLTWRQPQRIASLATIVACNRPGIPPLNREQVVTWVGPEIADRVILVEIPGTDLSATNLRKRVHDGMGLRFMTPRAVEAYIHQHRLYQGDQWA